jgi:hypothetical protein
MPGGWFIKLPILGSKKSTEHHTEIYQKFYNISDMLKKTRPVIFFTAQIL